MRPFLCAWIAVVVQAAGIRGTVVENQTGRPVSRAVVQVQPVSGTPGQTLSIRTNRVGGFELGAVAAGSYLVSGSRRGFMPAEYGQKRWNSAGVPLTLQAEETAAVTRTDPRGAYQFRDLAPGTYRLLSTFEHQSPAGEIMDLAAARSVQIEAHQQAQIDLDLYVLP